ncbi:MAG: sensor histidine kinase, partial [Dehalococcoidia bacterium]
PALDDLGLVSALREGAAQYGVPGTGGLDIAIEATDGLPPLPAAVEVAAYRIAQEAVTNVVRHASARTCTVALLYDDAAAVLTVTVSDDGRGLPANARAGVGLTSMRERAEELGGTLHIEAAPGGGTLVAASLPCRLPAADVAP